MIRFLVECASKFDYANCRHTRRRKGMTAGYWRDGFYGRGPKSGRSVRVRLSSQKPGTVITETRPSQS